MHDSIAPSGALTVPAYLLELPESVVEVPPVETRVPELPCDQLSWQDFERLVFRLARKNSDVVYCAPYGRPGQAQDGIDVYARLSGGKHVCWQARNRKDVGASDIEKAVDDFPERQMGCIGGAVRPLRQRKPCGHPVAGHHRGTGRTASRRRHRVRRRRRDAAQREAKVPSGDRRRLLRAELARCLRRRRCRGEPENGPWKCNA